MDAKQVSLVRICMSNFSSPQFHAEPMSLPHVTFSWIVGSWNVVSQVRTSFVLVTYEVQGTFTILEYLPCDAENRLYSRWRQKRKESPRLYMHL